MLKLVQLSHLIGRYGGQLEDSARARFVHGLCSVLAPAAPAAAGASVQLQPVTLHCATRPTGEVAPSSNGATSSANGNGAAHSGAAEASGAAPSASAVAALDSVADWSGALSLGEQQRLGWARLLLARPLPKLALLDEVSWHEVTGDQMRIWNVHAEVG